MKRAILLILLLGSCLAGCSKEGFSPGPKGDIGPQGDIEPSSKDGIYIDGEGVLVESEFAFTGFSEIEVSDFFEVDIRQGETYRVMVEAVEALMPYLEVIHQGDTITIHLKDGYTYNLDNASHRVEVTLPELTQARITNHSTMYLMDFEAGDSLMLEVNDFSELNGTIKAEDIQVEVSNHSECILSGSASRVMGEVTEFSDADLTDLEVAEVNIDVDTHSSLSQ
jgi:hypothetical protein